MTASGLFPPRACGVCGVREGDPKVRIAFDHNPNGLCTICTLRGVMAFGLAGKQPFKKMLDRVPDCMLKDRREKLEAMRPENVEDAASIARELVQLQAELADRARFAKD